MDAIFDGFLKGASVFVNRNVLRTDYVPLTLPHRDTQIARLASMLAPALTMAKTSNVFIYGKTGTGKTAVARFVLQRLEQKAREVEAPVRVCYANCRMLGTKYRVLAELCRASGVHVPFTGLASGELVDRFTLALASPVAAMVAVLDEADALVKPHGDAILYDLTRINEKLGGSWLALVVISNDLRFKEYLDPRVLSSLSEEEVVFKPYIASELYDILLARAAMAFTPGAVDEAPLRLCSALAAGEHGDARRALDVLRVAGELADRGGGSIVTQDHVREALREIERDRVSEALKSLPLHSKLLILAVYLLGGRSSDGSITGDVYTVYEELCRSVAVEPLTQRRVSGLISDLDGLGVLNARVVSFGRYGRTKRIRLGIAATMVYEVLRSDDVAGRLFHYVPRCLQKRTVRP